ncbi:MAG: hypothetical protein K2F90_06065 [Clostridiales bacterium]|nr:hypothetical protein [Clostridiales bacterium]
MTTQTLSLKSRISAIITALVLLLTALWTARPTFASADGWNEEEFFIDPDHVCTASCYRNIYYLTDNSSAEYYVETFLRGWVNKYAQQHIVFNEFRYYDLAAMDGTSWRLGTVEPRFGYPPLELQFYPIQNALVIYEINDMMPFQFSDIMSYRPTSELYDYFMTLKNNNCRIMFICNTDEMHFNDRDENNRFLDLVDVHVNTDIYSFFTETVLASFTSGVISNSTIILDRSMSAYAISGDSIYCTYTENEYKRVYDKYGEVDCEKYGSRYGFLDGMLIPHIRKTLDLPISGAYPTNINLLQCENIKVLCYLGEQIFYDLTKNTMYYWALEPDRFMEKCENDFYYFIGSTRYGDDSYDLRRILIELEDEFDLQDKINKYMFVDHSTCCTMEDERNMHIAGMDNQAMVSFIAPIVAYFLFDDIYTVDWYAIRNWGGRCDITIKPTSDESWLLPLSDQDDTIGESDRRDYYFEG